MAAPIKSAVKHIFKPDVKDPSISTIRNTTLNANVDVNRNTLFARIFDDEKGLGGASHANKAQDSWAVHKRDKEIYNNNMNEHREQLGDLTKNRQDAQAAGDPAEVINVYDQGIKATEEAMRKTTRKTSLPGTAWDATKHTFQAMNSGTAGQIATKWGAVAGAGFVINGTGRALSGGTMTTNASGERDIMGVPFV